MSETEKILEMISEGKISASDGERLLNAIRGNTTSIRKRSDNQSSVIQSKSSNKKDGNVIIEIKSEDNELVKLNLPVGLAGFILNMLPKDKISALEVEGIDISEIMNKISDITDGKDRELVNITTGDGASIRIYIQYH